MLRNNFTASSLVDWQESVKSRIDFTTNEPANPSVKDRYLNTATGVSSETSQNVIIDYIYEWNGDQWAATEPNISMVVGVEDE